MAMFGETLRQARAYKGVTLKEAEQATRINRHHLSALEDENFAALPPLIYQRGIVRNYAAYLDLDPTKLLALFDEAHGTATSPQDVVVAMKPLDMPSHFAPNFAIIAFLTVMSAIVFAWLYSAYLAPTEALPTSTPVWTVTPISQSAMAAVTPIGATSTPTVSPTRDPEAAASAEAAGEKDAARAEATTAPQDTSARSASATGTGRSGGDKPASAKPTARPARPAPTKAPTADVEATRAAETAAEEAAAQAAAAAAEEAAAATEAAAAEAEAAAAAEAEAAAVAATEAASAAEAEVASAAQTEAAAAEATEAAINDATLAISITPSESIYLSVTDETGAVVFDGQLAAGASTGTLRAVQFTIYSSDIANTWITNEDSGGAPFLMPGEGQGTVYVP